MVMVVGRRLPRGRVRPSVKTGSSVTVTSCDGVVARATWYDTWPPSSSSVVEAASRMAGGSESGMRMLSGAEIPL